MPFKGSKSGKKAPKPETPEESISESVEEYDEQMSVGSEEGEELDDDESGSLGSGEEDEEDGEGDLELDMTELEEMAMKRQDLLSLLETEGPEDAAEEGVSKDGKKLNRGKGVVYISRLPPGASAHQLRSLLAPYGEIGRIWIEMPESITRDRSLTKTKLKKLSRGVAKEGWVEFLRAKKAWKAARLLHCQPMGAGRYRHDLWNIKYLKDFSWNDLVNQHLHRGKMREARLRQSIARAKQEANQFLENRTKQDNSDTRNLKKRARAAMEASRGIKSPKKPETGSTPRIRRIALQSDPAPSAAPKTISTDLLSKVRTIFRPSYATLCPQATDLCLNLPLLA